MAFIDQEDLWLSSRSLMYIASVCKCLEIRTCMFLTFSRPVFSYKAVGVAKSGLKQAEIEQHAILHTTDLEPEPTEGELRSGRDRLLRRPIAVEPEEGSTLATSSRIRFDMPLTFKHNLKVRNVGQVVESHQQRLVYYWLQAMGAIQGR